MISIVTITFNNHDELMETICSLEGVEDIESIVINGGSSKETFDFLQSYSGRSVSEKDRGISDAFNKGLRLSRGDAVLFLNSGDTLIDKSYIQEANDLIKKSEFDFVYADILFEDPLLGNITLRSNGKLPNMPFNHPTLIVRKKIFDKTGDFDINLKIAMDLDFVYRMLKVSNNGYHLSKIVVKMDGKGVSSNQHLKLLVERVKVTFKNKDFKIRALLVILFQFLNLIVKKILAGLGGQSLIIYYKRLKH